MSTVATAGAVTTPTAGPSHTLIRGIFITGTDTEVGKTLVSTSLVRALVKNNVKTAGMKPIASGSDRTAAGLRNSDATALIAAANVDLPYDVVNPYCFEPAISPHIAADEVNIAVDLSIIKSNYNQIAAQASVTVVEGAGGWHAPLNATQTMADLPKALNLPVLLVVGLRLGCLNHALLSKRAIEADGQRWLGWVANAIDPDFQRSQHNVATLERLLGAPALTHFSFQRPQGDPNNGSVRSAEQLARALSLISA